MNATRETTVCGCQVQIDRSGVGHCWQPVVDLPASIREQIEGEIIDGHCEECADFLASNGQHYRWG